MANMLAWLTGREDRTQDPWPFQPAAPELRAYNPPPSERFANMISGALGAGPGASLARQRFAEGVPSVLSLFPPLGAGLSAADLLHAKAAGDPMGVAAAAIGMVPGARPAGQAMKKAASFVIDPTEHALGTIGAVLDNKAAFSVFDKANGLHHVFDAHTGKLAGSSKDKGSADNFAEQWGALSPGVKEYYFKDAAKNPTLQSAQTAAPAKKPSAESTYLEHNKWADTWNVYDKDYKFIDMFSSQEKAEGFKKAWDAKANAPAAVAPKGYALNPATGKYDVLDPATGKVTGSYYDVGLAEEKANIAKEKQQAALGQKLPISGETSQEVYTKDAKGNYQWFDKQALTNHNGEWFLKPGQNAADVPSIAESIVKGPTAPAKQVLDYEKDDNGLYHIFDAMSGKTQKVVDSQLEATNFIKYGKTSPTHEDIFGAKGPQSIPINQISTPSPKETKAPDLLEAQKRYEEAIAPLFQNLPPRAVEQGYTTPAFRGLKIREGDVAPVHNFDKAEHQYATANPMLADMYADYLSKHPGWQVPSEAFDKGASVAPLLLDTSKYHYYDAAGAHWSTSAGNQRGIAQAREKGAPGVIVDNVWDEPNSTHALGTPSKIFITFPSGASTVKSRFAERFDPTSPDMLKNFAGLAAGGTGLAALLGSDRAEAAAPQRAQAVPSQPLSDRINQIIDSLDWQDQWMGRMRLPLKRKAEQMLGETV